MGVGALYWRDCGLFPVCLSLLWAELDCTSALWSQQVLQLELRRIRPPSPEQQPLNENFWVLQNKWLNRKIMKDCRFYWLQCTFVIFQNEMCYGLKQFWATTNTNIHQ